MFELGLVPLGVAAIAVLVALSAFFSSSETAIFSLPAADGDGDAASGDARAVTLADLRADPHRLLVTILVGNNVVNVAISSITTVLLVQYLPGAEAAAATTVVASVVVLVFGEIVPKSYGLANARSWALAVARPLALVERALYPLVWAFDGVTSYLAGLVGGTPAVESAYADEK